MEVLNGKQKLQDPFLRQTGEKAGPSREGRGLNGDTRIHRPSVKFSEPFIQRSFVEPLLCARLL